MNVLDSNTSYVIINLFYINYAKKRLPIQIHLMLLLILKWEKHYMLVGFNSNTSYVIINL